MNQLTEDRKILLLSHVPTGLGLLFICTGAYFLLAGISGGLRGDAPTPQSTTPAVADTPMVQQEPTYRLVFDNGGAWKLTRSGGPVVLYLPEFLPEPAVFTPPSRPLTRAEIADTLFNALKSNQYKLSTDDYQILATLQLEGAALFADPNRLRVLLANGLAMPKTTSKPVAQSVPAALPTAAVNPNSEAFLGEMKAWRDQIEEQLEKSRGTSRGYQITFSSFSGTTRLYVSGKARKRILSDNFGTTERDRDIYRQVLVCIHLKPILVDGMIGPASRQAFAELDQKLSR